jgi:hypothetical protein
MKPNSSALNIRQAGVLLRGYPEPISRWVQERHVARALLYIAMIIIGSAAYGAVMGIWRSPQQALYSAIKLPLVVLLTAFGNALLNGMLAPLLGLNLGFRQSLLAVLMSFTIAAMILGAFSPIVFFLLWNAPPMASHFRLSSPEYSSVLLMETAVVAFAGIVANVRLLQLLERLSGSATIARKILFAWLAGNLFLGAQISWILRPFVSLPDTPVCFLMEHPFQGNFFEAVLRALKTLIPF